MHTAGEVINKTINSTPGCTRTKKYQ